MQWAEIEPHRGVRSRDVLLPAYVRSNARRYAKTEAPGRAGRLRSLSDARRLVDAVQYSSCSQLTALDDGVVRTSLA